MKVLVLGSHCDDIELGCGATLFKHRLKWDITCATFATHATKYGNIENLSRQALSSLGLKDLRYYNFEDGQYWKNRQEIWKTLNDLCEELIPDLVITQLSDQHQDHTVLAEETARNFKKSSIIAYRSSVHCNDFAGVIFEELTQEQVNAKLRSLSHYVIYTNKIYFKPENVTSVLRVNGMRIESEFAETFNPIRMIGL